MVLLKNSLKSYLLTTISTNYLHKPCIRSFLSNNNIFSQRHSSLHKTFSKPRHWLAEWIKKHSLNTLVQSCVNNSVILQPTSSCRRLPTFVLRILGSCPSIKHQSCHNTLMWSYVTKSQKPALSSLSKCSHTTKALLFHCQVMLVHTFNSVFFCHSNQTSRKQSFGNG